MDIQQQIDEIKVKISQIDTSTSKDISFDTEMSLKERLGLNNTQAFPIGSVFISVVSTDPSTLLGYGTWSAFATGRTIVGIDADDTDFDTVEETGGEKDHTLTTSELPAHTHSTLTGQSTGGSVTAGATTGGSNTFAATTGSTGSGSEHNNLQPYIVVYMWKRTA